MKDINKQARFSWEHKMRKRYPGFNPRKWAMNSYRLTHPQYN